MTHVNDLVGRPMTLGELAELSPDDLEGTPNELARYKAWRQQQIKEKGIGPMEQTYVSTADRAATEVKTVRRIAPQLGTVAEEVLEDLRTGRITADQALRDLSAVSRDLKALAADLAHADEAETKAFESIDVEPQDWQAAMSERMPAMFKPGRPGLSVLEPEDLTPPRRRGRGEPQDAPDEDDLRAAGYGED
jgi:hypothetical protein